MDAIEDEQLPTEGLHLYFTEVLALGEESLFEVESVLMSDVEQATDFLNNAGLADLTKLYQQGREITDSAVNESIRQRHLTEKQANTVRSRVRTLNQTLKSRQPRRKQRQDIRDIAWNFETSSTGTRSRSATPDSLDSIPVLNEDLTSDEDQQLSLPPFPLENGQQLLKAKLKWTTSEPLQNRVLNKHDRGDIAHLGSENVVLMGYHPINEPKKNFSKELHTSTIIINNSMDNDNTFITDTQQNLDSIVSDSPPQTILVQTTTESPTTTSLLSFEGLVDRGTDIKTIIDSMEISDESVKIDDISDGDYQYLKPLLWLEVSTIFDHQKISVVKRKANSKYKKGNVFGVKLSTLVMRDLQTPVTIVPQVYEVLIDTLIEKAKEDGLLRIAAQKQKMESLSLEVENNFYSKREQVENTLREASPHELTGVLKKLLRELPDPIFTMELIDMFYKTNLLIDTREKVRVLNLLVLLLPVEHRNTFRILQEFFIEVVKNESSNRMSMHNVSMIIAPSFFPPKLFVPKKFGKPATNKESMSFEVNLAATCCNVMEILLCAGNRLFLVPKELVTQAEEAKTCVLNRRGLFQGKQNRPRTGKKKLQRSSTQYEPGATLSPRIKRDFVI